MGDVSVSTTLHVTLHKKFSVSSFLKEYETILQTVTSKINLQKDQINLESSCRKRIQTDHGTGIQKKLFQSK